MATLASGYYGIRHLMGLIGIAILSQWPIMGFCQNSRQLVGESRLIGSKEIPILQSPELKWSVRSRLSEVYLENQRTNQQTNGLYKFNLNQGATKDDRRLKPNQMLGGWTSGGGTGVACFHDDLLSEGVEKQIDPSGRLRATAYDKIKTLTMLDYVRPEDLPAITKTKSISVKAGETPIEFIRRIVKDFYSPSVPLFADQLLRYSEAISQELNQQMTEYKVNPSARPQLNLRDFGPVMQAKQNDLMKIQCLSVQLATRYVEINQYKAENFFIDFDIKLILKMRDLAPTYQDAVAQEAALILHEAVYMMGTLLQQKSSEDSTFIIVPYLLSESTLAQLNPLSKFERARQIRVLLESAGMRYFYFILRSDFVGGLENEIVSGHFRATREITETIFQSCQDYSKSSIEEVESLQRRNFLFVFSSRLQNLSPAASFVILSSVIGAQGPYFIDDLFLEHQDQSQVINFYCRSIRQSARGFTNSPDYHELSKTFENALQYCQTFSN